MRILVDGDACPDKEEIKQIAQKYQIEMYVFIDYAHILEDDYYRVVNCEIGKDSVDMIIVNQAQKGDLVITQDYGLAGLLLAKGCMVLHISGMIIDYTNIDNLLMSRYAAAKERRHQKHLKGPSKRTDDIKNNFLNVLESLIKGRY